MRCFLFHKWGDWQRYQLELPARQISANYMLAAATEYGQVRVCQRCNKMSRRELDYIKVKDEK